MKSLFRFFLLIYPGILFCQNNPHYLFIENLTQSQKHKEAIHLLHFEKKNLHPDTSNYLFGTNFHYLKMADSAALYLDRVSAESPFYFESFCYQSLNLLYKKKYPEVQNNITTLKKNGDYNKDQLLLLIESGNFLLQRNFQAFDSISSLFTYDNYKYTGEQQHLLKLKNKLVAQKKKSPFVAGMLSAFVPGLGKYYAGRKGAAMAALSTNMVLAGFAAESYYRSGYNSPQFITFGTIFVFFYTGNILGSAYSVKQQHRSTNGKINNEILATLHIPINRVFNR